MQRIEVRAASASYDVVVEAGLLEHAHEHIGPLAEGRRLFVIADEGALGVQGERLARGLAGLDVTMLPVALGEERKRLGAVEELALRMHAAGADRKAIVVAFGGGIAGDIGGFVAASYMRGVDVIQIPTTLLAQVDASIGGKTGVNLASGKNLVGAFHQPRLVLIDPESLNTLPEREYRAGLNEVLKAGVIWSRDFFDFLVRERAAILAREPEPIERILAEAVRIKADVVAADEREGHIRRILNYGHTLGHGLEAETDYRLLLHGEAVAWGMIAAGRLGERIGVTPSEDRREIEDAIRSYGTIPPLEGISPEAVAGRVAGDKKTIGGKAHFVLAERIGKVIVRDDVPHDDVVEATREALAAVAPEPVE